MLFEWKLVGICRLLKCGNRMNRYWLESFEAFFRAHGDALVEVLDTACCRENWLHGELFRWFRFRQRVPTFKIGSLALSDTQKADFSAEEPIALVGEVKLLGWDYQSKGITGGSIKPVLERLDKPVTVADRDLLKGPWGLIPDFFRLIDFVKSHKREALLIVIADERRKDLNDSAMARSLRQINFVRESLDIPFAAGLIRIWTIQADDLS